jgi:hypothetical protein
MRHCTSDFRALLLEGEGSAVGASFAMRTAAALVIAPVGKLVEGYDRFVVPIGLPLVLAAAVFGGRQVMNG